MPQDQLALLLWFLILRILFRANFARKNLMNNAYNYSYIYLKAFSHRHSHANFAKQYLQLYVYLKENSNRSRWISPCSQKINPKVKKFECTISLLYASRGFALKIRSYFKIVGRSKFGSFVFFSKNTFLSRSKFTSFCLSKNR